MSYPPPSGYGAPAAAPDNNMGLAVGSLIFGVLCGGCLGIIPGIVAVVNASKVKGAAASGNGPAASEAAANARKWAMIAFVVSAIVLVLQIIYFATSSS